MSSVTWTPMKPFSPISFRLRVRLEYTTIKFGSSWVHFIYRKSGNVRV